MDCFFGAFEKFLATSRRLLLLLKSFVEIIIISKGSLLWNIDFHFSCVNFLNVWNVTKKLDQIFKNTKNYLLHIELASTYRNASCKPSCLACCSLTQSTTSSTKKNLLYTEKCYSIRIFVLKNILKDNRFLTSFRLEIHGFSCYFITAQKGIRSLFTYIETSQLICTKNLLNGFYKTEERPS